ncbi:MAG TPA: tetratricopeptide repeat protein [Longimicrobiales bacterium]|nr:tetratricopeptide repeat protein [Longimicrobiales bacterium]
MPPATDPAARTSGYPLKFLGSALVLVAATLLLVLVVLPKRYVLSSGFRESGMSFPVARPPVPALPVVQRTAPPRPAPIPALDTEVPRGPAERLWDELLPLMDQGCLDEALTLLRTYLEAYPGDRGVWREYANTLLRAGHPEEAADALRTLLSLEEDPELRLLLARTLRDLGRMEAASAQYALLAEQGVEGSDLSLEWAQALSWVRLYPQAEEVLVAALEADPGNVALQLELARVYYYAGRLAESEALLARLDDATLESLGAGSLREDVAAALAVPEEEPAAPPTLLEQAAQARVAGDFQESARLLREALDRDATEAEAWKAYADLLQYELADFQSALDALREYEGLVPYDPGLQFRMAQLELWTGSNAAASQRLDGLLTHLLEAGPAPLDRDDPESPLLTIPDVQTLRGDLLRWEGQRVAAAREYGDALGGDPDHEAARDGLAALRADVDRQIDEMESPRAGGSAYGLADTDEFRRLDAGAEWIGVDRDWVWGIRGGSRWLQGFDALGGEGDANGLFTGVEGARWWRWGTIRTAAEFGLETVREGETDLTFGASARFLGLGSFTVDAGYRHGPAYDLTSTLQSVFAEVVQDHLRVTLSGSLTPAWSLWAESQATWLDSRGMTRAAGTTRVQGSLSLGRQVTPWLSLGMGTSVLGYSDAAPESGGRPLFWDPRLVVSVGPYAALNGQVDQRWDLTGRIAPGVAFIEERSLSGTERVPQFSAEAGIRHRGDRVWSALDLFMVQGKFDGYRAWGARLSLSLRNLPWGGGER